MKVIKKEMVTGNIRTGFQLDELRINCDKGPFAGVTSFTTIHQRCQQINRLEDPSL